MCLPSIHKCHISLLFIFPQVLSSSCVECSPKFGPKAFELIKRLANGEKIPTIVGNIDRVFTKDNPKWVRDKYGDLAWKAEDYLPEAF